MKDVLTKLFSNGRFTNVKHRVWTLCQCAIKMSLMAVEEAEKEKLTNEQFYIAFQDTLNAISVKDPNYNVDLLNEFNDSIKQFLADSK